MARLPVPGSDSGQWGDVLNEYLAVAHQAGGALKPNAVTTSTIQDAMVTKPKLDASVQASLTKADTALDDSGIAALVTDNSSDTGSTLASSFAALTHTHVIANVTNLQSSLDAKSPTALSTAVLIQSGGSYPTRPSGYANARFIGASDPGVAAQDGDEWIQLT